jgi:hypothetical protein
LVSSRSPSESDEARQTAENVANAAGEVASDAVANYLDGKKHLEKFRAALVELVAELSAGGRAGVGDVGP